MNKRVWPAVGPYLLLLLLLLVADVTHGQVADLTKVDLLDLMSIEVTSVAKKEQKLSRTASAVFVITQEDIRRSGATSIPDLLRMVPGLDVAQINSSTWAISARGLNGQYSNKLLVLIDGRSVYSPMFSGVLWDEQVMSLENVERIEVIRGPGATVWGSNAVNGVINITTKKASETQGGLLRSGGGTYEHGFGTVRIGGKAGNHTTYRVSASGFARDELRTTAGSRGDDGWNVVHGGFRADSSPTSQDSVMLEGNAHSGRSGEIERVVLSISPSVNGIVALRDHFSGWDLISRWEHEFSSRSKTSLQVYFDRDVRADTSYGFSLNTLDLDFQHHVGWGSRQDYVWGLGYRTSSNETSAASIIFNPARRTTHLYTSFVQDEIAVLPDRVYLSLGAKFEQNDYTGFSLEPSARISWTPNGRNMFWAAGSGADRTPARSDSDVRVNFSVQPGPNGLPLLVSIFGNPKFKNENLGAAEVGYRTQITPVLSVDSTIFYNSYQHLSSLEPGNPYLENNPSPHIVVPSSYANLEHGETHGIEVSASLRVCSHWSVRPSYSYLIAHIHNDASSRDTTSAVVVQGSSPDHQVQLQSRMDLSRNWEWNTAAYFVGRLVYQSVPSYTRVDTNLVWKPTQGFSISLVGQNLLKEKHEEFSGTYSTVMSSMIKRSVYTKVSWKF